MTGPEELGAEGHHRPVGADSSVELVDGEPIGAAADSPVSPAPSSLPSLSSELRWLLSAICFGLAGVIAAHFRDTAENMGGASGVDAGGIAAGIAALTICASVTLASIQWRRGPLGKQNPVASSLLTVAFRTLVMLGCLGLVAATKWPHRNSFLLSLLGCYFLFLILESGLSIRWYSSLTRVKQP